MVAIAVRQAVSEDEYFALETEAEVRHEFCDGEVIEMPGALPSHNIIAGNFFAILNFLFRRQSYQAYITDQRLWIPETNRYVYPDVMVIQEPLELKPGRADTVINPVLVAEVLSQSTRGNDLGDKFTAYRTIPSLMEYLTIEQDMARVNHWGRSPEGWLLRDVVGLDGVLSLRAIAIDDKPVEIQLADLYNKVEFETV